MRLLIDLQGAQSASALRGIGRFSRELARAMASMPGAHEPVILLNEALPEQMEILCDDFARLLPRKNIQVWRGLADVSWLFGDRARRRATEAIRAQVIAGLAPDLVHVSSIFEGAGDNAVAGWPMSHARLPTVATFYDAIPLLWKDEYLTDADRTEFYFRHLHELRCCQGLLAISQSSRREAIAHVGADPESAFNVLAGFDADMFRPRRPGEPAKDGMLKRDGVREDFILFVGAGDPRKNDQGLVRAYAKLPASLRQAHQLVIVGSWNPRLLRDVSARAGVDDADLVLIERVGDDDLPEFYRMCACFVMPSKHEGFGLPALEAAACGAPVIAGGNTSLPEVVGWEEALFDAADPASIAEKLLRVLTDKAFRGELVSRGLAHAAGFTWAEAAHRAWAALEAVQARQSPGRVAKTVARKPSLAFVGPLPPDESGIAEYASDLLPSLAAYYDITLVCRTGLVDDPMLRCLFPIMSEADFAAIATTFDRIVYQLGNSEFHVDILERLMPRYPGVAVLHDCYISNIPFVSFLRDGDRDGFARKLFASHGWPAIAALAATNERDAAAKFPCMAPVYRHGLGVLQHSRYARAVVAHFLGDEAARQTRVVPFAIGERRGPGRDAARMALNIPQTAHLTCSFGMIAPTKRPVDVLQAWFAAFGEDPAALLAFVGDSGHDVCRTVTETATALGVRARVILAGRTTKQVYLSWLDAADLALQLRCESRGETSAAIADCLSAGLPVVVNAHGASAELPQDAVVLLPDEASISTIGAALGGLRQDPARGERLQAASRDHATTALSPVATAAAYHDAIEYFTRHGKAARLQAALPSLPASDHAEAARALAGSFSAIAPGRLLLDASHMATLDLGTGIQRVIREISRRVLIGTKPDRLADMVRLDGTLLRHARVFGAKLLGLSDHGLPEPPVLAGEGDTIVLMDNYGNISQQEVAELRGHHRRGAKIIVLIYDILPLQRPDWFPPDAVPLLRNWLHASLGVADAALCISRSVAEELDEWLRSDANPGLGTRPLDIGWFPLGADFCPPQTEEIVDRATELALASAALRPTLLMVGTVEPRKGYGQALAAFEQVWSEGLDIGLTIVGKPGWSTEALRARLAEHPETAGRLHWLQQPSDSSLARLYKHHSGLLAASEGEGFGLPIIEAARAGLPILARDINVFREVAGESALWFAGNDPASLAAALRDWHRRALDGSLPDPAAIRACDWDESTAAFLDPILTDAWPMRWSR